jgi:FAD synthetase
MIIRIFFRILSTGSLTLIKVSIFGEDYELIIYTYGISFFGMAETRKKVMVFGSFDQLHPGHLYFLLEAKKYGDELIVVLGREETIKQVKGKKPKYSEKERKQHLEITGTPDKVVYGKVKDKYEVIKQFKPDIICLGYDQHSFSDKLSDELERLKIKAKVVRLKPYKEHIFKSSKLK